MTQIGLFEATPDGYAGCIHCLTINAEVRIVEADLGDAENAPDYRIMLGESDDAIEVGAGWKRIGEKAGQYLSLQIDDPTLAQPIYANLFQSSSDPTAHILLWNRPIKRGEKSSTMARALRKMTRSSIAAAALALLAAAPASAQPSSVTASPDSNSAATAVSDAAHRFGIPEHWIYAVMRAESAGRVNATSPVGAQGLMQIMPATWAVLRARYGLGANAYDPRDNIMAGAAYIREMYDQFGAPGFLGAYNAGPGRYGDYVTKGRSLPAETRAYIAKIAPALAGGSQAPNSLTPSRPALPAQPSWTHAALFAVHKDRSSLVSSGAAELPSPDRERPVRAQQNAAPNGLFVQISERISQ